MKKKNPFHAKFLHSFAAHKTLTAVVIVTCAVGTYGIYRSALVANAAPQYVLSVARLGTLSQTVSGTGQVSASNETNIQGQVSGTIETIDVSVGQSVSQGQLIATIDDTDALNSLKSAQIALGKLTEAPKPGDIAVSQGAVVKDYQNAADSISSAFTDLPNIVSGMNGLLYQDGGFLSPAYSISLNTTAQSMRTTAGQDFDQANSKYAQTLTEYEALTPASATTTVATLLNDTYTTLQDISTALSDTQNAINYIAAQEPGYYPKDEPTAASDVSGWINLAESHLSSISGDQTSINNDLNSLNNLVSPPDTYDVQSAELSLAQAQQTYDNYFIRAPYDGVIGSIPVSVFGQASGGTTIATIFGAQKIATISLDEVDAANVQVGQPVSITFDAISNFTATGSVEEIDQVGTVVSGVVSYPVKISINTQDDRIKPGMSVNVVITTKTETGVLLVPSSAIKTQGTRSYVQVLASTTMSSLLGARGARTGSSTRQFGGAYGATGASSTAPFATSSAAFGSSTGGFRGGGFGAGAGGSAGGAGTAPTLTVTSAVPPQNIFVTTGDTDSSNTVILSGLNPGTLVVTRTIAASAATTAAAPSLLSSLGAGGRPGAGAGAGAAGGGAFRAGGGGGAAVGAVRIGG